MISAIVPITSVRDLVITPHVSKMCEMNAGFFNEVTSDAAIGQRTNRGTTHSQRRASQNAALLSSEEANGS